MSRQKQVYETNQIAHLWFHASQNAARNTQCNFYFTGDTIYSYRDSFPIARIVEFKKQRIVLFTTDTYGNTTAKHIRLVRQAIPHGTTIVDVHNMGSIFNRIGFSPDTVLMDEWRFRKEELIASRKSLDNEKRKVQRLIRFREFQQFMTSARQLADIIGVTKLRVGGLLNDHPHHNELVQLTNERDNAIEARGDRQRKANRARWYQQSAEVRERFEKERIERERLDAMTLAERIENWRNNGRGSFALPYDCPTMLRINSESGFIETSRGAFFPIAHAIRLIGPMLVILARLDNGELPNGFTFGMDGSVVMRLGSYEIDRIDPDGTIHAGCHTIARPEVEKLLTELEKWRLTKCIINENTIHEMAEERLSDWR